MIEPEPRSEIARLMQQIELEYQAAHNALYGLSAGTTKHEFITAKMERMGELHEELKTLVGAEQAIHLLATALQPA
jgi:hypothetical protein